MSIGSLSLNGRAMIAAGIYGDSVNGLKSLCNTTASAVVTKSITINPTVGNEKPNYMRCRNGWLNNVGLTNPGLEEFVKILSHKYSKPIIASLAGDYAHAFQFMAERLNEHCNAYEINMSCPNIVECEDDQRDFNYIISVFERMRMVTKHPIFLKIGYGMREHAIKILSDSELIDAFTVMNSLPVRLLIPHENQLVKNILLGLSGPVIRKYAIRKVKQVRSVTNLPIIGCGGICTTDDAVEFFDAGANLIQIGSGVIDNLSLPSIVATDFVNRGL